MWPCTPYIPRYLPQVVHTVGHLSAPTAGHRSLCRHCRGRMIHDALPSARTQGGMTREDCQQVAKITVTLQNYVTLLTLGATAVGGLNALLMQHKRVKDRHQHSNVIRPEPRKRSQRLGTIPGGLPSRPRHTSPSKRSRFSSSKA